MSRQYPVGIDLGTTFSAAAWVDESGRTEIIRNAEGELLTPSAVMFADRELVVGKEARSATTIHPEMVAEWVKRDMGLPYYTRPIHGRKLPPEVIQACILRKLKGDIIRELGRVDRVVITVPAYFDEPRRKGTADAGEMAGLKVLDIVNEPTAAALSFGETLGYLTPGAEPKEEMTLLVYDLGGGTFDVTLLRLSPGKIQTIATDGDVMLGGHDWDLRLVDYVARRFKRLHKRDPREDPVIINRALAAAIDAKHALSARGRTTMRIEVAGQTVEVPVTRGQFEEMTADLLERTTYTARQLLAAAKMEWKDVSRVLLVGGSTRMPMVGRMLRELSGMEPDHTVNPDEAVARGAALYAAHLLDKESGNEARAGLSITNVNSHSLGVEGIDPETLRKKNVVLIPRNTPLPAKFTERFVTRSENQRSIAVQILEGESSMPGECTAIGRTVIRDLPEGLPKNWPIEVAFEYAENGRLTVKAVVPGTHQGATLDMERSVGVSRESVARWKQPIDEAAGFDAFESMVQEVMEQSADDHDEPTTPEAIRAMQADFSGPVSGPSRPGGWTPFVAGPRPLGPEPETSPEQDDESLVADGTHRAKSVALPQFPRWVGLIGHVIAALLGLALGYLILCRLRPETFPFPW
ncbi:MAG: Hsp70 family protein [Planctomycetes bacterium]|nr:Hsp70 family protein [Planctomycetota bacterium]MBU4397863.1 Hsp70 family protein [Planctomycetota bacterium]MCG2683597.1 Hsp70 family protein [Planctomycetales bacterium]